MAVTETQDHRAVVRLADGLSANASEACTQTFGLIAAKGGGKSYLASVFVEGLYDAGAPFAVFDPIGNWHSLTLAADGKSPGLAVVVIGGERADVPIDEDSAEALGDYLVSHSVSAVIDVSELSKARRKVFVAAVCEAMFRAARRVKSPYMVVLEEAQLFAPQHAARGEERMLGAVTDIVRLGRNHGLGAMLLTQRPQSVSKEVLNQVECLLVGQLRGPQERKAIGGWITEQGVEEVRAGLDELPRLSPGEFFCWSPSWLRVFRKVRIGKKRTFDGSSTPVLGQRARPLPSKGARGLDSVIAALSALAPESEPDELDEVVEDDPGQLELIRQLAVANDEKDALAKQLAARSELLATVSRELHRLAHLIERLEEPEEPEEPKALPAPKPAPKRVVRETVDDDAREMGLEDNDGGDGPSPSGLDRPARIVLSVLAWQRGPIPRKRLALLCRYSAKGGGFGNILSRLRKPGFITGSGDIEITDEGRNEAGDVRGPPRHPAALFEWWLAHPQMDGAMVKILRALKKAGRPVTSPELAELAGYKPGTGGFNNPLSRLRTLGLVVGKGREKLRLVAELQDVSRAGSG